MMRTKLMKIAMLVAMATFLASATASAYTLPIAGSYTVTNGFWSCDVSCYHLGDDISAAPDTEVRSVCAGTVVEVTYRNTPGNYGGRVLIECQAASGPEVWLYGHLGKGSDIYVRTGQHVQEAQAVGKIGDRSENGGFIPHLHLGLSRGTYRGSETECDRWVYAGYTAEGYDPTNPCYCAILDNWDDPSEALGIRPRSLQIIAGDATPAQGFVRETDFRWHAQLSGGRGAQLHASVLIRSPAESREYEFPMSEDALRPGHFEHTAQLVSEGSYGFRFKVQTCAEETEEAVSQGGPMVTQRTAPCVAQPEICDGRDNDCNGQIDEHVTVTCQTACGTGVQVCDLGRLLPCTAPAPRNESCNNQDDDCDGQIDNGIARSCANSCGNIGTEMCRSGVWGTCVATPCPSCVPSSEVCDGIDNDCNGNIDEALVRGCTTSCGVTGTEQCGAGQWGACISRISETCNGIDDDCDGQIDEQLVRPCTTACGTGNQMCLNGAWSGCSMREPESEVCNGLDDDCDGQVDEGITRQCSSACGTTGTETCANGSYGACSAQCQLPAQPLLRSPADAYIEQAPYGFVARTTMRWYQAQDAVSYEYEVSVGGLTVEHNTTTSLSHDFWRISSEYGKRFEWKVRAVNTQGQPGPWSETRSFFLSHIVGELFACTDSRCPSRNACYKVSRDVAPGNPDRLIIDYVSASCLGSRTCTPVSFANIESYARSSRFNGCPP